MERSPALTAIIRLGWTSMIVTNTVAYYDGELITAVKGFIIQVLVPSVSKFLRDVP